MMHRNVRYPLAKFSDCLDHDSKKILAFTIRTTDGTDEDYASKVAESKGTALTEELICFSIVSYERDVDGKAETIEIKHPFGQFRDWSTKARNFVVAAWRRLATPDEKELADFFANASESAQA
jgi:hypothetical protein